MVTMNSIIASLRVCALVRMHNVHLLQGPSIAIAKTMKSSEVPILPQHKLHPCAWLQLLTCDCYMQFAIVD